MSEVNLELLTKPFPKDAIKQRRGPNNVVLNYLEGGAILQRLIVATGNQFDFRVMKIDQMGDVMCATVELEIPGLGKRQQIGVQRIVPNSGEDLIKGCLTDGLKRCAMNFGVGLELYPGSDCEIRQTASSPGARPVQAQPQPQAQPEPQTERYGGNGNGNGQRTRVGFRPLQAEV